MNYYSSHRGAPLRDSPLYHLLEKFAPEAIPNLVVVYFSDIYFNMQEENLLAAFRWSDSADGALYWIEVCKLLWFLEEKEQL